MKEKNKTNKEIKRNTLRFYLFNYLFLLISIQFLPL